MTYIVRSVKGWESPNQGETFYFGPWLTVGEAETYAAFLDAWDKESDTYVEFVNAVVVPRSATVTA